MGSPRRRKDRPRARGRGISSERLLTLLSLVVDLERVDVELVRARLDGLSRPDRLELAEWAAAVHVHASDNDDVPVPAEPRATLGKLGLIR